MTEPTALHLWSKTPALASALKEAMLRCGGRMTHDELLFPVHPKIAKDSADEEIWMPVRVEQDDRTSASADRSSHYSGLVFNSVSYFCNLKTDLLGSSVLFTEKIPTTIPVVDRLASALPAGIHAVIVAAQQTLGKGRSGNVWESPLGCAMFSFPLTVPLSSKLGQALSFVQHLVATACILAVRRTPGYEEIDLRIKWPNDLLTSDKIKVGGILISSSIIQQTAFCNVGIGFNVSNSKPTVCLNDLIEKHCSEGDVRLEPFDVEAFIARTLTELEGLLKLFAAKGANGFLPLYMRYWLHKLWFQWRRDSFRDQEVRVRQLSPDPKVPGKEKSARILGLDEHGFLLVRTDTGELWGVQSDGNRFDMMANLLLLNKIS